MEYDLWPTTREVSELFTEEVGIAGGTAVNTYEDDRQLIARAVLPAVREAGPGDRLQGGVALWATEEQIRVHPYVFRQVCSNGAIFAQTLGSRQILRDECEFVVIPHVRAAIRECYGDEAFAANAGMAYPPTPRGGGAARRAPMGTRVELPVG